MHVSLIPLIMSFMSLPALALPALQSIVPDAPCRRRFRRVAGKGTLDTFKVGVPLAKHGEPAAVVVVLHVRSTQPTIASKCRAAMEHTVIVKDCGERRVSTEALP